MNRNAIVYWLVLLAAGLMAGCFGQAGGEPNSKAALPRVAIGAVQADVTKSTNREGPSAEPKRSVRLYPIISYRKEQAETIRPAAEKLAEAFEARGLALGDTNPRCCLRIELIGQANPGEPGWILLHEAGGSILWATDEVQLAQAAEKLIELSKASPTAHGLPIGVTTNYLATSEAEMGSSQ